MENVKPYNDFGDFLRKVFPCKVQKISINAGFTCPNRDGSKGWAVLIVIIKHSVRSIATRKRV